MAKKRPADVIDATVMIGKIATGEIGDLTTCKNAAAVALRRMGGKKVRSGSKCEELEVKRGRDDHCSPPPAQIRAGGIPAHGSYLGCMTAKRLSGYG